MSFDKSKDYLKQTVRTAVTYYMKTAEGEAPPVGRVVDNCVFQSIQRTSDDWTQGDSVTVYLWREMWLVNHAADRLPMLSDRLNAGGLFWTVTEVEFTDMDDSSFHQRYKLSLEKLKGGALT